MMGVFEVGGIISETTVMKKVRDIRTVIPDKEKCWLIERANFSCMYNVYGWMIWRRYPMSVIHDWLFENITKFQLSTFGWLFEKKSQISVIYLWMTVWKHYPMSVVYCRMFENVTLCQLYMAECVKMLPNVSCI